MKQSKVIFTPIEDIDKKYYPIPAKKNIPEWYKEINPYTNNDKKFDVTFDGFNNLTIKKCIPLFDSLTAGYIIKTHVDIMVKRDENNEPYYLWPQYNPISFHPLEQSPTYPKNNEYQFPKWMNPWSIKTESGYSCLFISPMNNPNDFFTIFPGIVDTDTYTNPVNFPFILNDKNFSGIIPAGTAVCQAIPFKRQKYKMIFGSHNELEKVKKSILFYTSRFMSNYKNNFWHKKEYE